MPEALGALSNFLSVVEQPRRKRRVLTWVLVGLALGFGSSAVASTAVGKAGGGLVKTATLGAFGWFAYKFYVTRKKKEVFSPTASSAFQYDATPSTPTSKSWDYSKAPSAYRKQSVVPKVVAESPTNAAAVVVDEKRRSELAASREQAGRARAEAIATAPAPTRSASSSVSSSSSAASSEKKSRSLPFFSKKHKGRATDLEVYLAEACPEPAFAEAVAGLLLVDEVIAAGSSAAAVKKTHSSSVASLTKPWLERERRRDAERRERSLRTWRGLKRGAASHFDAGVRETEIARTFGAPSVARWRSFCEANEVISYRDAGAVDVDDAAIDLKATLGPEATLAEAAEVVANVVSALLTAEVDRAARELRVGDHKCLAALSEVASLAANAGSLYEKLGLPPLEKPVQYEGKFATKAQLQSLFSKYASAAVARDVDKDAFADVANLDVANVDILQVIFNIPDRKAQKLTDQVVKQLIGTMLGDQEKANAKGDNPFAGGAGGQGDAEALASLMADPKNMPSDTEIDAQLDELQQALDSNALSSSERDEIRQTFQTMLGGTTNFDDALKAAEANKEQLDPRSKKALDLLRRLM